MFYSKIFIYVYVCFCFLLVKRVTKARNLSACNCILLESCQTFNAFIDNSSDEDYIKNVIQNAVCVFDSFSIFVCCPDNIDYKRTVKKRPKLDYLDELTGLNCPPSFGNEYSYDDYIKAHDIEPKYYDHHYPNSNNNHPPYHHNLHGTHVPFFPHTHTNNHNHDYPIDRVTPNPTKEENSSCGLLPSVPENNIEVYPWIIRLAYLNSTSRTIRYRCMGAIISDEHVLTAAHCVEQLVPDLRLIYARIGDDANFNDFQVLETIVHPNYNEPLFNNDVAILKLSITTQNKGSLKKVCLPKNITYTLSGEMGVVAGWSNSGISKMNSSTIRYINLPIMNNTECAIRYAKYSENFEISIVITPTEFCAKAQAMNDVCEGDSGGPFMERSKSGRYTLLGIVAFGPKTNCGQSNLPGVYMRVSSYVDWIKNIIQ